MPRVRRFIGLIATGAIAMAALAGCGGFGDSSTTGYVTPDKTILVIDAAQRTDPVSLAGEDLDGAPLKLQKTGEPTVLNIWGSWCGECRVEAPILSRAARELNANFVGIAVREKSEVDALGYNRTFDIEFPSFYDPGGDLLLAFNGKVPYSAVPTTVILDKDLRVAAVVVGELSSLTTLSDLVEEAGQV